MALPLLAFLLLAPQTIQLTPTDDVWVYGNASDPAHDVNLRIWGTEGLATPKEAGGADQLSMAYLKWDLSTAPAGKKLTKATLVVNNIPNPGYTIEQATATPLEARPLVADFDEKTWEFGLVSRVAPAGGKAELFGTGAPKTLPKDQAAPIEIDLMKGPGDFAAFVKSSGKQLRLALTSTLDMASLGRSAIYKIYSREEKDETLRPRLVLVFE